MKTKLICIIILCYSSCTVTAQDNFDSIKTEMIFLHTDRNNYVSGENLFYTLYLKGNTGQMSKYAYLIIRDHNNSHVTDLRIEINNGLAYGNIYLSDTLNSGIYQVVCYTNCMRNYSEESYFRKEIVIANRFDETIERISESGNPGNSVHAAVIDSSSSLSGESLAIALDKLTFNPREKISFSIQNNNAAKNPVTHLSIAICEAIPAIPADRNISEYFGNKNGDVVMNSSARSACRYFSEIRGAVLQGKILFSPENISSVDSADLERDQTKRSYTLLVSAPDSIVNMQFSRTDSTGAFSIPLNSFYDGKELVIRLKEHVSATIVPDNKFILNTSFNPSKAFNIPGIRTALIRSAKIARISRTYGDNLTIRTSREFFPSNTVPRLYYNHYTEIFPSDYVALNDFTEISREIIPALKIRKTRDRYIAEFPALHDPLLAGSEPAIFLDGVPIDDINQVITMGTDQIKRIESLPAARYYGDISFSGILAVFSVDHRINNIKFRYPALKMNALLSQPYTRPQPFIRTNPEKHHPDLRQLLFWEPDIVLINSQIKQFEFYASDIEGKFLIDIQGISSDGNPVHGSATITIKSKPD